MPTIDADAHVIETDRTWAFIDKALEKYRPRAFSAPDESGALQDYWLIDGRALERQMFVGERTGTSEETREAKDIEARLKHMDELETDVHVLYPTRLLHAITEKAEVEVALFKSYNRWLAEIWSKAPDRLRWGVLLPYRTMDVALEEMRWARDHGAVSVILRPYEIDKPPSDEYFYPVYEEAIRLDMPIAIHVGSGSFLLENYWNAPHVNFIRSKLCVVGCFHNLVMSRTPARFPKLRWAFIEATATWLPMVWQDLPVRMRGLGVEWDSSPHLLRDNNIYITCQTFEDLPYILQYAGEDNLVIGSDYGHADAGTELEALRHLKGEGKVPAHVVDKILKDNPSTLYAL